MPDEKRRQNEKLADHLMVLVPKRKASMLAP